jgi:hypothetical protein
MFYYVYIGILVYLATYTTMRGCPTCIGKVDKQSPPVFSKEFESRYRYTKPRPTTPPQEVQPATRPEKKS